MRLKYPQLPGKQNERRHNCVVVAVGAVVVVGVVVGVGVAVVLTEQSINRTERGGMYYTKLRLDDEAHDTCPPETKSGTRKIADILNPCTHPEHNPPSMRVYESGIYEHVCPGCGARQVFTVANPTL